MILIGMTDIHGDTGRLDTMAADLAKADVVVVAGDLTHFGHRDAARRVVDALRAWNPALLAVPGNCDYREVDEYLTGQGINLHGNCVNTHGVCFLGAGGALPGPARTPREFSDDELGAVLGGVACHVDFAQPAVLVVHNPPLNTVADRVTPRLHVGSASVRRFVEEHQPILCLTGHIHEGRGIDTIGRTRVVNPGPLREGFYLYAEIGQDLEFLELRD